MKRFSNVLLLLMIIFSFCSCSNDSISNLKELNIDLDIQKDQDVWICYAKNKELLLTVGKDSNKELGPVIKTEYIALYDLENNKKISQYNVDTDAYIANAVPYKNGILYVDYEGFFETVEWHLMYVENDFVKELNRGTVVSYERIPYLTVIDDIPVCLTEEDGSFSISLIKEEKLDVIYLNNEYCLDKVSFECNGNMYCFTATDKLSNKGKIFCGNINGIKNIYPLENKITSFSITDNYAVFALGVEETEQFYVQLIDLKNGEKETINTDKALWRMTGGKDMCLCVDNSFNIFSLNTNEKTMDEINKTDSYIVQNAAVAFHNLSNDEYIVRFDSPERPYDPLFYMYKR